jgi:chaperonin cofactor prefoldin
MNISIDLLFKILSLVGTALAVLWYVSNMIGNLRLDISKSDQLNDQQEKKLESLDTRLDTCSQNCRDGRVKIWEDLNALKLKVAQLEGKHEK